MISPMRRPPTAPNPRIGPQAFVMTADGALRSRPRKRPTTQCSAPPTAAVRGPRRQPAGPSVPCPLDPLRDRKSTRLNSSHSQISYAVFCLKKKNSITKLDFATKVEELHLAAQRNQHLVRPA